MSNSLLNQERSAGYIYDRFHSCGGLVSKTLLFLFALPAAGIHAQISQGSSPLNDNLANLSLEQLASIEVTTASKEPEKLWQTPAAIHLVTQEDIRRSGATSIPEILRLVPGVEVARIDSDHWAVGMRGFGGRVLEIASGAH